MPADMLSTILDRKRREVEKAQRHLPQRELEQLAAERRQHRSLLDVLRQRAPLGINVIAEVKRASPSRGVIQASLDAAECAADYIRAGAVAISVLTDSHFFKGRLEDLVDVREVVSQPILRKEFIVSPYQIHESAALGADAVLLIVRALTPAQLGDFLQISAALQLDALVEVHDAAELETALTAGAHIVGINNRNLKTFKTSVGTCVALAAHIPAGTVAVAESGIVRREQVETVVDAGIINFLIGESLVRSSDRGAFLAELAGRATGPA